MKRPLGFVAMVYGGGLVLGEFFRPPLPWLFSISIALALAALSLEKYRRFLTWPLILLTGLAGFTSQTASISPHDLRSILTEPAEDVVIRGCLLETPSERIYVRNGVETYRTLAEVSVTDIRRNDQWQPAFGKVMVTTPGTLSETFFSGQQVEVSGIIAPPRPPLAEGLFDYRAYLKRKGIHFQLKPVSAAEWRLISDRKSPPLSDRFLLWAKSVMASGLPEKDKPLRLLWAMTLGEKNALTSENYEPFVESGTMHLFAISGLHIALIAGILVSLLRVLRVSRMRCGLVVIPLIWFYTGATGWQPSAVRSTLMMSIIIAGWSLKRPADLLNSLAAAALIILACEPQQLFQAGFQLSFFVVLSIALLLPPLEKIRDRLLQHDPMLPSELIPRWQRWLGKPLRWLATGFATSLAAWLGAWPLTVYYFHLFSPVTLLANLVLVPVSSGALACALGSLLFGSWFPALTELLNHSGWFWMLLMMNASELAARLPGAFFYAAAPTPADFVIYYGSLMCVLTGFAFSPRHRILIATALASIAMFYGWRWHEARTTVRITALPVSGGAIVYCNAPGNGSDLLVDCGNASGVEFIMKPFLHGQGLNRLPRLALTHGDQACVGGAELLRELMPIDQIVTSSTRFRSSGYRSIVRSLEDEPERWLRVKKNDHIGNWTVLHPPASAAYSQADDSVLVLRGDFNGIRVLLLSELGSAGQEALLQSGSDLRSEIVVCGIPNQGEPLREALLKAVNPKVIVVVDSEFPVSKRACASLKERLALGRIPVIYTRDSGSVRVTVQRSRWSLEADEIAITGSSTGP